MMQFNGAYPQYPMFNPSPQQLIRVTGLEGARAYQMSPNSAVPLFDSNEDLFYIKTTDGAGFPTIRTFEFKERTQLPKDSENLVNMNQYISRDEFEEFKKEIMNYGKQFVSEQSNTTDKSKCNKPSKTTNE